ncbi:hypothetical protein [Streptomyces chartreusis]
MVPFDCGTVVQVGSALAHRGIPLQSAYCGAKHAVQGSPSPCAVNCCTTSRQCPSPWSGCRRSTPRSSPGCAPTCRATLSRCRRSTSPRWR